ncbi:YbaN family protein [Aeromonas salmonicida]|uniref:YbaN family protein n=1 Tax=Aeromonas salmonicida TaxID=645 RepID=UPI00343CD0D8
MPPVSWVQPPLPPTTLFMLLAAALFARSSPRFHRWLLTHPWFGPPIVDWQQYRGIRRQPDGAPLSSFCSPPVSLAVVPLLWVKGCWLS